MTREEFESILEEAFLAGYNDAIDEIFEEDNTFDLEEEMDSYLENTNRKHPERAMLSRVARASEKIGLPREISYRMAQKSAQGAYKASKSGANDFEAGKAAAKAAIKDYFKRTSLHDRINHRGSNDKIFGVGKARKNRVDALTDELEKQSGKKIDRDKFNDLLKSQGIDKKRYNG